VPVTVFDTRGDGRAAALATIAERTGDGVDAVLEMSGAEPAINDALAIVRPGGQLRLLGLTSKKDVTIRDYSKNVIFKGVDIQAIIGRKMYGTWYAMLGMLEAGLDVEPIVTAEYDLEQSPTRSAPSIAARPGRSSCIPAASRSRGRRARPERDGRQCVRWRRSVRPDGAGVAR
jgi:threonine dehydrogenase-like Zn-dependent dehydrogenase